MFDKREGPARSSPPPHLAWIKIAAGGVLVMAAAILFIEWFVFRQEVEPNQILVLVNKTGRTLPPELRGEYGDQIVLYPELVRALAAHSGWTEEEVIEGYKGIRLEVLGEGRYFLNPWSFGRLKQPATVIGQNEIGVLIRRFGKPLPFPKTVATEPDERGPVAEILTPGRHNINLLAYDVQKFKAIEIPEGHRGVVTLLSGTDPVEKNTYTVERGAKGVQRETLLPGLEYYNPYLKRIETVDIRSHKYDMLGPDAIHFPSNDSFTITLEGTIEWAIHPDYAAEVTVRYGDEQDILNKVILPNARSIARIQGSKLDARDFIHGKSRQTFQENLRAELRQACAAQGIEIREAAVRDIQIPAEIASLISQREQADQEIERSTNQMAEARAEAQLVEQQELREQNSSIGDARRQVVTMTQDSEQHRVVAVTQSHRELEVAELQLPAAEKQAAALRSRGEAEASVVLFNYQARAEPLASAVAAFGDGETYAQLFFLERIAPSIQSILTNTEGPFADIFKQFQDFAAPPASAPSTTGGGQ